MNPPKKPRLGFEAGERERSMLTWLNAPEGREANDVASGPPRKSAKAENKPGK